MPTKESEPLKSRQTASSLEQRFHDPDVNYERLRGEVQAVRDRSHVWDTNYTLERYVSATDGITGRLDGSISSRVIDDPVNPEASHEKPDAVIWLDKSARPVAWFVDAFWEQFAKPGEQRPADEFLNIDRVNWFIQQGYSEIDSKARLGPSDFDIDAVSDESIARLRAIFTIGDLEHDDWETDVWNKPTRLDGKNILVIDEVKNRGGTLTIACQLLKRAIPEATISGDYFWKPGRYSIGGINASPDDLQMESAPVWYDSEKTTGRGIGEISNAYFNHLYETNPTEENFKKKLGWIALSAPHFNPETFDTVGDRLADQLKQDIAFLSYAVADGRVLRVPDMLRLDDEAHALIEAQGLSLNEYAAFRRARGAKNRATGRK